MKKTLLIVEDTPDLLMNLIDIFTMEGYVVHGCASASSALVYLQNNRPDLIITDLSMPDGDGYEFIAAVRREQGLKNLPVVIFSARPKDESVTRMKSLKVNLYVTKPCDPEELTHHIEQILEKQNGEQN